jgi:hypothetical protein
MKSSLLSACLVIVFVAPGAIFGQTATKIDPTSSARPIPEAPTMAIPVTNYSVGLKWNESKRSSMGVNYKNESKSPLKIEAVQTSGAVFLIDYPKTISPGGTGVFTVLLDVKAGTQGDADLIVFKSSEGEKTLRLNRDREVVATFDKKELNWSVGEKSAAKSVTVKLGYGKRCSATTRKSKTPAAATTGSSSRRRARRRAAPSRSFSPWTRRFRASPLSSRA